MDLNLLNLGTLLVAAPCGVFYPAWHQIYWRFDRYVVTFAITLIWYHTHWQTHTEHAGTNRLTNTYKYILTLIVVCKQQLPALNWMTNLLIQKFTLQRSTMSLLFHYYSLVLVILDSTRLSPSCETKIILIEVV